MKVMVHNSKDGFDRKVNSGLEEAKVEVRGEIIITEDSESSEDEGPHYQSLGTDDVLQSENASYRVLSKIGRGSFGAVYRSKLENVDVAIKISNPRCFCTESGRKEASILAAIGSNSACLRIFDGFMFRGQFCMVVELLQQSLQRLLINYCWKLSLAQVRPIIHGLACALAKLDELGIVHADLKPDNIMIIDQSTRPFQIKVIDFGQAHYINEQSPDPYIQVRFFRAPELILGSLPYSVGVDMWAAGCTVAECVGGGVLYPGRCDYDQMRFIVETQGVPDQLMMNQAKKRKGFFIPAADTPHQLWRLKTPEEFISSPYCTNPHLVRYKSRRLPLGSLDEVIPVPVVECRCAILDRQMFLDLLKQMLQLNPERRITARQVLQHPFVTKDHLAMVRNQGSCTDHFIELVTSTDVEEVGLKVEVETTSL